MIKLTDDNEKECAINEKYITAVHMYTASNGNGKAVKILLCHTGYLGLWYHDAARANDAFTAICDALNKYGWRG